jgi:hypothetical protein
MYVLDLYELLIFTASWRYHGWLRIVLENRASGA